MKFKTLLLVAALSGVGSVYAADTNVALGKATTASTTYDSRFVSSNVTDGDILDGNANPANASFWIAAQNKNAGEWVQVDLGDNFQISSINLFDTHNRWYNDRGTKDFTVSISSNGTSFTEIATGTFSNSQWQNQTAYSISPLSTVGRYVRFTANSGYGGNSTGLSEIQVFGSVAAVPEPESYAMLLAGLGVMGTIARRRSQAK